MKNNIKVLLSILLLMIFLGIATRSNATTLTEVETGTMVQENYEMYEANGENINLKEVFPDETQSEFGEITTIESEEIYNTYNQEEQSIRNTSVEANETTMTQYERGRLNSKVPTVDTSLKIYDYANLFTEEQEKTLFEEVSAFIEENDMDMAIVTISQNPEYYAMNYADDFYDYNEFGTNSTKDGLLFLIDMDTREMWISTTGAAINRLNDKEINRILDKCYAKISDKKYFECSKEFIKYSGILIKSTGTQATFKPEVDSSQLVAGGVGAFIVGIIYFAIGHSKHKLIRRQYQAHNYENKLNLTQNSDVLLHHHVNKVYSPRTTSSSSGIGGSSIHVGSSGSFHGGGGRHF